MKSIQETQTDMPSVKGKTILQVIPNLESGGAERTTVDIARGITQAGGRALVASAGGSLVREIEAIGGTHITLPLDAKFRLDRFWTNKRHLISLCQTEQVDLIHARSRAPAFAALGAARACSVPFITTYHGIYSEKNALKRWYNSVMVAGDAVIANSQYTRDLIVARYGTAPEKLHVVHRGTDLAQFDPHRIKQTDQDALRQRWHLPADRPVVMLMARLTDWKGHLLAVDVAERLKAERGVMPCFVFAGRAQSETYAARVRSAIVEARLLGDVHVVGHTDNVPLALSLADLVIVPSTKPEAFGRSVAEASAMGLPVIAFDHGGAVETIACPPDVPEQARTGMRVPLRDISALAGAVRQTLSLPDEARKAMGQRGRAHIAKNFSTERMIADTLEVYERVLR